MTPEVVISLIALIISGVSLKLAHNMSGAARDSANAAKETAELDRQRRHDELAPGVEAHYVGILQRQGNAEQYGIEIIVTGQQPYSQVTAELLESLPGRPAVARRLMSLHTKEVGSRITLASNVQPHDRARLALLDMRKREDGHMAGGQLRILLTFQDNEQEREWTNVQVIDIPEDPKMEGSIMA